MSDDNDKQANFSDPNDSTETHLLNPLHAKIQAKFDLVFGPLGKPKQSSDLNKSLVIEKNDDLGFSLDIDLGEKDSKPALPSVNLDASRSEIDLDFGGMDFDITEEVPKTQEASNKKVVESTPPSQVANTDLDFTANFTIDDIENDNIEIENHNQLNSDARNSDAELSFTEGDDDFEMEGRNDQTQKTIVISKDQIQSIKSKTSFEVEDETNVNLFETEDKSEIDSAIIDIVSAPVKNVDPEISNADIGFAAEEELFEVAPPVPIANIETKKEVRLTSDNAVQEVKSSSLLNDEEVNSAVPDRKKDNLSDRGSFLSEEDSTRVHATIRQLREEREDVLNKLKSFKVHASEVEQDNLTLKAALDEARIEISIIKKRHLTELEDMKDRVAISEKKKLLSDEKARSAETLRLKLEQKIRIDFNQIKQREKELETKLEMLTVDIDSRVQTRDQKILELKRKIDSLEFNMENVSIREQKSHEDKIKLEDKLNKIMKTLRHSIKNLEDDIDLVSDESLTSENEEGGDVSGKNKI